MQSHGVIYKLNLDFQEETYKVPNKGCKVLRIIIKNCKNDNQVTE